MPFKKGHTPWNKNKTGIYTEKHLEKLRENGSKSTGKALTPEKEEERKKKISESMKKYGGYRIGSGRGKKGWYKGFFCDSSWELAFVLYCLDHKIKIERNTTKLDYTFNGKKRKYIPDFVVDGIFVEIKGYKTEQWNAKHEANPDVKVYYENDLQQILEYVVLTYGKDYIRLYE
jgi:hypothetical protein